MMRRPRCTEEVSIAMNQGDGFQLAERVVGVKRSADYTSEFVPGELRWIQVDELVENGPLRGFDAVSGNRSLSLAVVFAFAYVTVRQHAANRFHGRAPMTSA